MGQIMQALTTHAISLCHFQGWRVCKDHFWLQRSPAYVAWKTTKDAEVREPLLMQEGSSEHCHFSVRSKVEFTDSNNISIVGEIVWNILPLSYEQPFELSKEFQAKRCPIHLGFGLFGGFFPPAYELSQVDDELHECIHYSVMLVNNLCALYEPITHSSL